MGPTATALTNRASELRNVVYRMYNDRGDIRHYTDLDRIANQLIEQGWTRFGEVLCDLAYQIQQNIARITHGVAMSRPTDDQFDALYDGDSTNVVWRFPTIAPENWPGEQATVRFVGVILHAMNDYNNRPISDRAERVVYWQNREREQYITTLVEAMHYDLFYPYTRGEIFSAALEIEANET